MEQQGNHYTPIYNVSYYYSSNETLDGADINDSLSTNGTFEKSIRFTEPFSDSISRAIIIVNYTIVFLACFIGNVLVLFVIARNKRMRTRTNQFLANLAIADLCVGIFCIFPNMHKYLFLQWYLGKVMCKMYRFMESMNLTASMLLLEMVAVERYIAINHPLKARRLFTRNKMFFAQFAVWIIPSIYNIPILFMFDLHEFQQPGNNHTRSYCYPNQQRNASFSSVDVFDTVTFVVWYMLPLIVMTAMYVSMAHTLWGSTLPHYTMPAQGNNRHANVSLCLSPQTGRIENKITTSIKTKSEQYSSTFTTTIDSSPSKESRLRQNKLRNVLTVPNELELLQLYKQNKPDQLAPLHGEEALQLVGANPRVQGPSKSHLSSCSSNSSENDPFSFNHHLNQQLEECESITPNGEPDEMHLEKLLDTCGGSETHNITPLVKNEHASSSNSNFSRPTASTANTPTTPTTTTSSTRNCRYRLTSHRASRRRVVRLLIIVLGTFALLVLPHHIRLLHTRFHENLRLDKFVGPVCHLLMFLNSAVNPVLYSLLSQSFRRNLKETFHSCKRKQPSRRKRKPPAAVHCTVHRTTGNTEPRALNR